MKEEKPCRFIPLFTQPIISGKSSITMRPKSPGDLTYLETDYTVVSTTNSLNHILTQSVEFHKPTDSNWDSVEKSGMCFGNRTQRTSNTPFLGKYYYHTDHSENPERSNVLNVLPISQYCWGVGEEWD